MATETGSAGGAPAAFEFPPHFAYPPFFTLQPVEQTRARQLSMWTELVLAYCAHARLFVVDADAPPQELFANAALPRKLEPQGVRVRTLAPRATRARALARAPRSTDVSNPSGVARLIAGAQCIGCSRAPGPTTPSTLRLPTHASSGLSRTCFAARAQAVLGALVDAGSGEWIGGGEQKVLVMWRCVALPAAACAVRSCMGRTDGPLAPHIATPLP